MKRTLGNESPVAFSRGAVIPRMPVLFRLRSLAFCLLLLLAPYLSCTYKVSAEVAGPSAPPQDLTTAAQVLSLPVESSRTHLKVSLRGVVTAAEPDWQGKFVIQDETAGLFVQNVGRQPAIGDLIEVSGTTGPG